MTTTSGRDDNDYPSFENQPNFRNLVAMPHVGHVEQIPLPRELVEQFNRKGKWKKRRFGVDFLFFSLKNRSALATWVCSRISVERGSPLTAISICGISKTGLIN